MGDFYKTISAASEGLYKEKMSKFISFARPVESAEQAREVVKACRNAYHDARHVCWAYMLGAARTQYLSSDDGEPSGTAGRPILGQINSFGLTNVVVVVVRYFGGIKLGTPGLIGAYRQAAAEAIRAAEIVERHEQAALVVTFSYLSMNDVMRVVKGERLTVVEQSFDNECRLRLSVDADSAAGIAGRLLAAGASVE